MSICIILVESENPDNIGAAARAMKNTGLRDLRLVAPPPGWKERGRTMAVSARDVLERARVFCHLKEALKDVHLTVGTTRRARKREGYFLEFDKALEKIAFTSPCKRVALVFGKESKGLANRDLLLCDWFTTIPSHPAYPSINLAQAVMILAFSLYRLKAKGSLRKNELEFLPHKEVENALHSFAEALGALEYKSILAERIGLTFQAMIKRSGLVQSEAQMIKGISRRIRERTVPKFTDRHVP